MIELLASDSQLDWRHGQPGYAALIFVILLAVAVTFLVLSFLKHVRKAREPWDDDEPPR